MPVDRATFDTVRQRVIAAAPAGLSRDQFNQLLDAELSKASAPAPEQDGGDLLDVGIGVAKGIGNTVAGLGELVHRIPGVSAAVDTLYGQPGVSQNAFTEARRVTAPTNTAQSIGRGIEQVAEFFTPVGAAGKAKAVAEIGKSALLTGAQGGGAGEAAFAGGLSAVIPGAGVARRGAQALKESAEPLVRAAIKPTVTALRRISGAGGLDAKANALVRFIIDKRLTSAEKAQALFQQTENELKAVLSARNAPTDAATRATRYLQALERSAQRQGLPADDVAQINKAAADLLEGPMGEDVITMVATRHPTLVGANGQPLMVMRPQTTRQMRAAVPATEALDSARASSRWRTNKQWGEQKGTPTEAAKTVERAQRDAVKVAIPAARPLLATESKALQSQEVLDRMAQRAGNRDAVSLPAHVIAGAEIATGRVPLMAFAANWLRNNQMKAGIWADTLGKAIEKGNTPLVADILKRLGVGSLSQAAQAATAP